MWLDWEQGKEELKKLVKFGLTGVCNTLVDAGVSSLLLVVLGVNVFFSKVLGYGAGILNSYLINRSWTFHSSQCFFSRQLIRFVISNFVTLAVSLLLIAALERWGVAELPAMLLSTCITVPVNFLFSRLWVFR